MSNKRDGRAMEQSRVEVWRWRGLNRKVSGRIPTSLIGEGTQRAKSTGLVLYLLALLVTCLSLACFVKVNPIG